MIFHAKVTFQLRSEHDKHMYAYINHLSQLLSVFEYFRVLMTYELRHPSAAQSNRSNTIPPRMAPKMLRFQTLCCVLILHFKSYKIAYKLAKDAGVNQGSLIL